MVLNRNNVHVHHLRSTHLLGGRLTEHTSGWVFRWKSLWVGILWVSEHLSLLWYILIHHIILIELIRWWRSLIQEFLLICRRTSLKLIFSKSSLVENWWLVGRSPRPLRSLIHKVRRWLHHQVIALGAYSISLLHSFIKLLSLHILINVHTVVWLLCAEARIPPTLKLRHSFLGVIKWGNIRHHLILRRAVWRWHLL